MYLYFKKLFVDYFFAQTNQKDYEVLGEDNIKVELLDEETKVPRVHEYSNQIQNGIELTLQQVRMVEMIEDKLGYLKSRCLTLEMKKEDLTKQLYTQKEISTKSFMEIDKLMNQVKEEQQKLENSDQHLIEEKEKNRCEQFIFVCNVIITTDLEARIQKLEEEHKINTSLVSRQELNYLQNSRQSKEVQTDIVYSTGK